MIVTMFRSVFFIFLGRCLFCWQNITIDLVEKTLENDSIFSTSFTHGYCFFPTKTVRKSSKGSADSGGSASGGIIKREGESIAMGIFMMDEGDPGPTAQLGETDEDTDDECRHATQVQRILS